MIGLLTGSFIFLADLVRALGRLGVEPLVDFIAVSHYGTTTESSDLVKIVNERVSQVLQTPETIKRLAELGLYVETNTPEQYRELIRADIVRLGAVVKGANAKRD